MQAFKDAVPTMIGGAADLVESTKTEFEGGGLFSAQLDRAATSRSASASTRWARSSTGSRVHGGCVKPYGSTFLIFSDYMRPAVRLSALMGLPVRLGRGRTTRSGSARTGRRTSRSRRTRRCARSRTSGSSGPADANETARRVAASRSSARRAGRRCRCRARRCRRSTARDLAPASGSSGAPTRSGSRRDSPDLILIATGREVVAGARGRSQARRRRHRRARRLDAVLGAVRGAAGRVPRRGAAAGGQRAPVDRAGVALGWRKWVGDRGGSISIEHFGASAPATVLASSASTSTTSSRERL